jgi:hypothetical protein
MAAGIASFLALTTGPARLRAALGRGTSPLGVLLKAIDAPRGVRNVVPQNVLGGDIFSLMSGRLQQLLLYAEQPAGVPDTSRAKRADFAAAPQLNAVLERTEPFAPPTHARRAADNFAPLEPAHRAAARAFADSLAPHTTTRLDAPVPPHAPKLVPNTRTLATDAPVSLRTFDAATVVNALTNKRAQPATAPALLKRLQEYWQLSRREPSREKDASQRADAETFAGKNSSPPHDAPAGASSPRPWPELAARQAARKIFSAASRPAAHPPARVRQTINHDAPDKIEIQNIFNIEMKPDEARGAESGSALAESLADILREQALQHGIDVT